MYLRINGAIVMYSAIESVGYDGAARHLVVRTITGKEHRTAVTDRADAQERIGVVMQAMGEGVESSV